MQTPPDIDNQALINELDSIMAERLTAEQLKEAQFLRSELLELPTAQRPANYNELLYEINSIIKLGEPADKGSGQLSTPVKQQEPLFNIKKEYPLPPLPPRLTGNEYKTPPVPPRLTGNEYKQPPIPPRMTGNEYRLPPIPPYPVRGILPSDTPQLSSPPDLDPTVGQQIINEINANDQAMQKSQGWRNYQMGQMQNEFNKPQLEPAFTKSRIFDRARNAKAASLLTGRF